MQREKMVSLDELLAQRVEDAVVRALAVHGGHEASTERVGERLAYSMEEAAELLGVGRSAVYDLARTNRVKSVKIGRRRLVTRQALIEFLAQREGNFE